MSISNYKDYAIYKREAFLDNAMKKINSLSDYEIKQLANKFKNTMITYQKIFGNQPIRQSHKSRRYSLDKTLSETLLLSNKALF
ncbi:MAG: hypothetical protein F6K23_22660 [Okeania sp. SIO2C9]|uniref:hypothetical protein n=1 Tax=Okeania sp. SIO2C9 TaxID=2607791 RepID=UPI0013BF3047|nr:hypothetical protein [Okeania sp. SIO2C9]NEQ75606.1 hypothetical protein [Okeania sp. SIO2C9]